MSTEVTLGRDDIVMAIIGEAGVRFFEHVDKTYSDTTRWAYYPNTDKLYTIAKKTKPPLKRLSKQGIECMGTNLMYITQMLQQGHWKELQ